MVAVQEQVAVRRDIGYLHLLRVKATYLVILLHCVSGVVGDAALFGTRTWWVCNAIGILTRTGVPLFFMMSGFLLLEDEKTLQPKAFYCRRLGKILLPFLVWDVVYYLQSVVFGGASGSVKDFFSQLVTRGSGYHLWFVYQLLAIYLLAPFFKRMVDKLTQGQGYLLLTILLLPKTFFALLNIVQSVVYLNPFDPLMEGYLGYFLLGYLLGKFPQSVGARWLIYLLGLGGVALGVWGNFHYSTPENMNLFFNNGYALNHYLAAAALFVFFKYLPFQIPQWVNGAVVSLSKASFGIYLSHVLVLWVVTSQITGPLTTLPAMALAFVFTAVGATVVMLLVSKIKYLNRLLG